LVAQLDTIEALAGVKLILTLNVPGEPFLYEKQPLHRLRLTIARNASPLGFGANHNQAFEKCETPWFAILNPDLSLPSDVFTPLIQTASAENAALIAPCVVNTEGVTEDSVRWNLTPWSLFMRRLGVQGESCVGDHMFRWFAGMFYVVSSAAFRQIGGFDTRYFLYCEDYDLCARMHLANHKLRYEPGTRVIHDARRASWKSSRYLALHMNSLLRVWCSNPVWRIAFKNLLGGTSRTRPH